MATSWAIAETASGALKITGSVQATSVLLTVADGHIIISGTVSTTPQTISFSITIKDSEGFTAAQHYVLIVDPYTVTNTSNVAPTSTDVS